jgi:hypothetical protein
MLTSGWDREVAAWVSLRKELGVLPMTEVAPGAHSSFEEPSRSSRWGDEPNKANPEPETLAHEGLERRN